MERKRWQHQRGNYNNGTMDNGTMNGEPGINDNVDGMEWITEMYQTTVNGLKNQAQTTMMTR